ncbi:MAG: ArsA family ATPase [Desulfobulbaceae bacterium]|nr:ArsA family ATPase [Desulfobulbaceae bacterium]
MKKIEMFTGKGGVGKTTMSVATALQHSEVGKTLLISTDPSGSLSEIFSRPLDRKVHTVAPNLDAVELTRKLVLELWREKFAEEIYSVLSSFLPVGREIIDYIEGAPGIDEEFMLDYLLTIAESGDYRTIIWDTAPTVTTLNLLFVQQMFYSHLTQAHKLYFKVKKVFNKVDPLALIDKWRSLTERIIELLQTETCAWVVANPEPLPIEQAFDIADSFNDFGIEVKGFILNKVLPAELCQGHPFWQAKFSAQQKCREKLQLEANNRPIKEIPELIGDMQVDGFLREVAGLLHKRS